MTSRLLPVALLTLATVSVHAAPTQEWFRTANLLAHEYPTCSTLDSAGNFIFAGSGNANSNASDIVLFKYSPTGALVWSRRYAGSYCSPYPKGIAVDKSNNILVVGQKNGATSQALLLKYTPTGSLALAKTLAGTANGVQNFTAAAANATGEIFVAGAITNTATGRDAVVRKYSAAGAVLWTRQYAGGGAVGNAYGELVLNSSGDVIAAGITGNYPSGALLTKIKGATGIAQWIRTYAPAGFNVNLHGLALDSAQNPSLLLSESSTATYLGSVTLAEYLGTTGAPSLSPRKFPAPAGRQHYPTGFAVDSTGSFFIAMDQNWSVAQKFYVQRQLLRVSASGTTLWTRVLNPTTQTVEGGSLLLDSMNNVFLGTNTGAVGGNKVAPILWKYNSAGSKIWTFNPKRGGTMTDVVNTMARKSTGEIYSAGVGYPAAGAQTSDIAVFKIKGG